MTKPIQTEEITLRPEVSLFAIEMERLLRQNDWKGGWQNETLPYLQNGFFKKSKEAMDAIDYVRLYSQSDAAYDVAIEDITHTANWLMMLADRLRQMKAEIKVSGDADGDR